MRHVTTIRQPFRSNAITALSPPACFLSPASFEPGPRIVRGRLSSFMTMEPSYQAGVRRPDTKKKLVVVGDGARDILFVLRNSIQ